MFLVAYMVRENESLSGIAARFGTTTDHLVALNPQKPGARLFVPGVGTVFAELEEDELIWTPRGTLGDDTKTEVSGAGATAAAAGCTAMGFPAAAPLCGYVGGAVVGAVYDEIESWSKGTCSASNWVCVIPPPEQIRAQVAARLAADPHAFQNAKPAIVGAYRWPASTSTLEQLDGVVDGLVGMATFKGFGPDQPLPGSPPAGTLRRALKSAIYLRALAGQSLTPEELVTVHNEAKTNNTGGASAGGSHAAPTTSVWTTLAVLAGLLGAAWTGWRVVHHQPVLPR